MNLTRRALSLFCIAVCCAQSACAQVGSNERPLILTSLAPIYQLTLPLLNATPIDLQLLPESPRSMQTHDTLFIQRADRFAEAFQRADVVITIGRLWDSDPFYISARQFNARVVNIDASKPYSHELDGVAVANSPVSAKVSPWFWLSPSNVIRIIDIVGTDLQALYPSSAEQILSNMENQKAFYREMKGKMEQDMLAVDDPLIYALAEEFIYLTRDLGIFIDGYFVKQDIDWTAEDYVQLTDTLNSHGVRVVIHKWEPTQEIKAAIAAAGAKLVVLDTLETSTAFPQGFKHNLDLLLEGMLAQ